VARLLPVLACFALGACAHPAAAPAPAAPPTASSIVGLDRAQATLERGARDLDVAIRCRALALLILTSPEPGGGPWGPRALWDPSAWVEKRGVEALSARIAEPETKALLRDLAKRQTADPYARGAAGMRLALAGDKTVLPELVTAYETEPQAWRAAPLALAAATMGDPGAMPVLDRALRAGELPLELGFVADIGHSRLQALVPALVEATTQVEEPLVLPLAAALVELGSPTGESIFHQALSSADPEERLEAIDFLVELQAPAAAPLLRRASHGGSDLVRQYAAFALLVQGEGSVAAVATAATDDPDREVRSLAVRCLGKALADGAAMHARDQRIAHKALRQALADPEDVVLTEALQALAQTRDPDDLALVAGLLDAEALALQVEAAGAFLSIRNDGG
jgi:HEAT repeat protein